jgi:hypothetical protein
VYDQIGEKHMKLELVKPILDAIIEKEDIFKSMRKRGEDWSKINFGLDNVSNEILIFVANEIDQSPVDEDFKHFFKESLEAINFNLNL